MLLLLLLLLLLLILLILRQACGYTNQFGTGCPLERSDDRMSWWDWQQMPRGSNAEGQPSYAPEWMPQHGTRREFATAFWPRAATWVAHTRRDRLGKQGLRVFEDRKSGRHRDAAHARLEAADAAAAAARLRHDALRLVALNDPQVVCVLHEAENSSAMPGAPATATSLLHTSYTRTLAALAALAHREAEQPVREVREARTRAEAADAVHAAAARTATVQSDYAAQLETQRKYTATCASRERHNFLVTIVGYKPYKQEPPPPGASRRKRPAGQLEEYRQHVDVFFAFHVAGFKVNSLYQYKV